MPRGEGRNDRGYCKSCMIESEVNMHIYVRTRRSPDIRTTFKISRPLCAACAERIAKRIEAIVLEETAP